MPHSPWWRLRNSNSCAVSPIFGAADRRRLGRWKLETKTFALIHAQRREDVLLGARVGGRGQRDAGDAWEYVGQAGEFAKFRAEFVTPLGDAVGLVNGEQGERHARQAVHGAVAQQAFGGDVEQVELPFDQVAGDGAGLGGVDFGVQGAGVDADLAQGGDLVVHQGDQRRDDDRGAGADQGGHLVADAFAAAGGHQHEGVAAGHDVADSGVLLAAEAGKAENLAQNLRRIGEHGFGQHSGGGNSRSLSASKAAPAVPWAESALVVGLSAYG